MAKNGYTINQEPASTDFGYIVRLVTPTTAIPVTTGAGIADTGTTTHPALTGANQTLLAANTGRFGATIQNISSNILYVKCGATATSSSFTVRLDPYDYFEVPAGYVGIIDAISSAASGNAAVTEFTT